ncbi:DUF2383 domain-containing protein [Allofrancisella frigidaquae]|uniref:DUF892 family protein n=1 Tax=Allofrancisella frigidaquae TaxID=1085644 RepID=A0A6M3HSK7_9GAMM|nr:DUF2383 domain-containing protein [Allofrancisella frigidaquae]KEI34608.1 hypothetical protein FRA_50c14780 [Francisella sp. W12-1067]QIV94188.1 DUF892 family protein [Allofrancisella frigidaquae]
MATLVGTQSNFAKALTELAELDFDAIEAYEAAINRLKNINYKEQLQHFKQEHEKHVRDLNEILLLHDHERVTGPSMKQWLTKGKVVISNITGDDIGILQAMITNEEDTNTAYERMLDRQDKWSDAVEVLEKGLKDERHHKQWLKETIAAKGIE